MKKVALTIAVILGFVVIQPVQAADSKALVIIDSYFDSKVNAPNVKCITLLNVPCTDVVTTTSPSLSSAINHGNAMVEVAKRQGITSNIIALRSGAASKTSVSEMTPANFIDALTWVNNNSSGIGAVSFSRFMNHATKPCMPPASAPYTPDTADARIKSLISSLSLKGIQVFAATGNTQGTKIDYPACILNTTSVSTGDLNKAGIIVSINALDSNTDYVASSSITSYSSTVFGLIPQTTSSATVAVATQYLKLGVLPTKVVNVFR